jgi:hypothetical protein
MDLRWSSSLSVVGASMGLEARAGSEERCIVLGGAWMSMVPLVAGIARWYGNEGGRGSAGTDEKKFEVTKCYVRLFVAEITVETLAWQLRQRGQQHNNSPVYF